MALKWIKAALVKSKKAAVDALAACPDLHDGHEAIQEFMTSVTGPDGKPREPSVLMICCQEDGVRVGLKDDDAGGWCWRTGKDLRIALDAIEEALRAGEGAFRGPRVKRGKK
jgi:hypothetical protein